MSSTATNEPRLVRQVKGFGAKPGKFHKPAAPPVPHSPRAASPMAAMLAQMQRGKK